LQKCAAHATPARSLRFGRKRRQSRYLSINQILQSVIVLFHNIIRTNGNVPVNRCAGGNYAIRSRSPSRHLVKPDVTSTGPFCHLVNESDNKYRCHLANPGSVEQTMWSTLDGCHVDDIAEAVHKVTGDTRSSSMVVGDRFADRQGRISIPRPPRFHSFFAKLN